MLWVLFTVVCYTLSSLGDKQISARLNCSPNEFAFLVSAVTAAWMAVLLPFAGWQMEFLPLHFLFLMLLVVCKLAEFHTSAILLKTVSAYELKAWLGMNIVLSYICNIINKQAQLKAGAVFSCLILFLGIAMILKTGEYQGKAVIFSILYILSKFFYGMVLGMFSEGCSSLSILFLVMVIVALLQLPTVFPCRFFRKKGISLAVLSRLPNTLGLLAEAQAALQNIFLYAMIQPMQLVILFVWSLAKKEDMPKRKLVGSILSIIAVCMITVVLYF